MRGDALSQACVLRLGRLDGMPVCDDQNMFLKTGTNRWRGPYTCVIAAQSALCYVELRNSTYTSDVAHAEKSVLGIISEPGM
jgi:hypothetical protein